MLAAVLIVKECGKELCFKQKRRTCGMNVLQLCN